MKEYLTNKSLKLNLEQYILNECKNYINNEGMSIVGIDILTMIDSETTALTIRYLDGSKKYLSKILRINIDLVLDDDSSYKSYSTMNDMKFIQSIINSYKRHLSLETLGV
jgi:hypothetical protein